VTCQVCQCSELDPCEGGCGWAEPGLCTACYELGYRLGPVNGCPACHQRDCTRMGGLVLCLPPRPPLDPGPGPELVR
jgi:hypothetical protein